MISSVAFQPSLPAVNFCGKAVTSPSCKARSRPIVAFATATATATEEARSSWTEKPRPSYLNSSCSSHYDILGIPAGASAQEIKAAYRRLARICHPDVAAIDRKTSSADEFMKIHAAYSTLSDPDKRANYDRSLFRRQRPLSTAAVFSGYTRRNWETDQCW
ncbi:chaperone protein dnaJ 11, chloroplastic [Vigna radiata var. radiata]|uniref:Chaperone protein dnaJ 11, chloroplastic n=1 Tax=Vigna radiata var. radiata TaxID=3916 RepID=A0A1S3VNX5_VIGRR|nr:chaperone protein dnaJ 11, chloroplastic [Vigna radiata var. radiata]